MPKQIITTEIIGFTFSDPIRIEALYSQWAEKYDSILILTVRLTHEELINRVCKLGSERIFFIDCISKKTDKQATLVSGTTVLCTMAIEIAKALQSKNVKLLVIDSLSSLLIYNDAKMILQFVDDLIKKARKAECSLFFLILEDDVKGDLSSLKMYVNSFKQA